MSESVEQQKNPKPAADASWQTWEHVVREVVGAAADKRFSDSSSERQDNGRSRDRNGEWGGEVVGVNGGDYFDRNGKKILNPKDLPVDEPVLSVMRGADGKRVVNVYGDKNSLEQNKAILSETISTTQVGDKTVEERKIQSAGSGETQLQTTFDKNTFEISFRIKSDGINQEISLDANSNLRKFEMIYGNNALSYHIENGKITGVNFKDSDGMERPLSQEKANEFVKAAESSIIALRQNNGIPAPIEHAAVKRGEISATTDELLKFAPGSESTMKDSVSKRRDAVSPDLFRTLLSEAKNSEVAKQILADISTRDYFDSDPLSHAIRQLREMHPEKTDAIGNAAIDASLQNSKNPLYAELARTAAEDPKFAQAMREIIAADLRNKSQGEKGPAVEMLMSMSSQWSTADFNAALQNMQPDQVRAFRAALVNAPLKVKQEAVRIATAKSNELTLGSFSGRDGSQINFGVPSAKAEQELRTMQDRVRLIMGRNELGDTLMPLPLGSNFNPRSLDGNPSSLDRPIGMNGSSGLDRRSSLLGQSATIDSRTPSLFDLPVHGNARQIEATRNLFHSAFPGHDLGGERVTRPMDTRYLADALGSHLPEKGGVARSADDVFTRWGIDTKEFAGDVEAAKNKYGETELLALERRVQMFNALDPVSREKLAGEGNGAPINESDLAGVVLNGKVGSDESPYKFLLESPSIEQKLAQETERNSSDLIELHAGLQKQREAKDVSLKLLSQYTSDGVSAASLVVHGLDKTFETAVAISTSGLITKTDLFESGVETYAKKQAELVQEFRTNEQAFREKVQENARADASEAQLKFAKTVLDYESLAQSDASQTRKDYMALSMVDRYGMDIIKERAPHVWQDLAEGGGFQRLLAQNLIQSDKFGEITGNRGEKLKQATEITDSLKQNESGNLDLGMRRKQALDVIDTDVSLNQAQKQFAEFGQEFATFSHLFESANSGTKYEAIVKDLKTQAKELEQSLTQLKREDLANLIDLQIKVESASRSAADPETKAALAERAASMKGVLDMLNPDSEQHKSLLKTLKDAQTRSFSADTLGTWMAENGPAIAATTLAVAVTLGTFGTGSPVAAVLLSSAAALGSTQVTAEALYQVNHNLFDTGLGAYDNRSHLGEWASNNAESFAKLLTVQDFKGSAAEAKKLISSFAHDVASPLGTEYAENVVMGLIGLGALRIGQAGISGMNSQWLKSLVANPNSLEMIEMAGKAGVGSSSKAASAEWVRQLARESAKEIGEQLGQEGVSTVAERALQQAKLNNPMASVLLAVSMGIAQGRMGSHRAAKFHGDNDLQIHSSVKDSVIEHLKSTGHHVEQHADGSYSVSKFSNPGHRLRISVSDEIPAAARQNSRHGLGVENATDLKIQELSHKLNGADELQAGAIEKEIKSLLVEKSKEYCRKLGLVERDAAGNVVKYLVTEDHIRLTNGHEDSYGTDNKIEISMRRQDPTSALFHEMKHMAETIERSALQKADPKGFDRRIREDVFGEMAQGGRSRIAAVDGELQSVPRTELKTPEQKRALQSLLMEYSDTNSSIKPEQISDWLKSKQDRLGAFSSTGLDSAAVADLMSAEMYHYQSVKRQAHLDAAALQNDPAVDSWTNRRAEKYRSMAEGRGNTVYDEPQLHKLTRGITEEALGTVGDTEHYNVFGPSERRAEVTELTNAIRTLKADADAKGSIDANVSIVQLSANLQKLTSSLAKMRDGDMSNPDPHAMRDAREAANKIMDKLPDNELGRKVAARLIDMQIVDISQVPDALKPRNNETMSSASESRNRSSANDSDTRTQSDVADAPTRRSNSQDNTFARQAQIKANDQSASSRAGKYSGDDLRALKEYDALMKDKLALDDIEPRSKDQEQLYNRIMDQLDDIRKVRQLTERAVSDLERQSHLSQQEIPQSSKGGIATQKMVTPWIADLFRGDSRYKVLAGGATADHLSMDVIVLDTKTGQYLPIDSKQYDPGPLPSLVKLAKCNPNDPNLRSLDKESHDDYTQRRQNLLFKSLAGFEGDADIQLPATRQYARAALVKGLADSPLTVLHNPPDFQNHLSHVNMKFEIENIIVNLKDLPPTKRLEEARKLEQEFTAQRNSVAKYLDELRAQAKVTDNPRPLLEYANSIQYKLAPRGYFNRNLDALRDLIARTENPNLVAVPMVNRQTGTDNSGNSNGGNRSNNGNSGGTGNSGRSGFRQQAASPRRY
jgi:hypothetical protein